jgi:hypothetical protein
VGYTTRSEERPTLPRHGVRFATSSLCSLTAEAPKCSNREDLPPGAGGEGVRCGGRHESLRFR